MTTRRPGSIRRTATSAFGVIVALGLPIFESLSGQPDRSSPPWTVGQLEAPPEWKVLERPKAEGVRAVAFEGLPFRGKPTQVFAWLGVPEVASGQTVPAMVLVHGGGGTAFDEWVRLWMERGYAAIAMDTCGQVPVGNYGEWTRAERGGPPGWGGFDQLNWNPEDQWTFHAVADVVLAHSLIRSMPGVDPDRVGLTGISWGGYLTCIVAGVDARFKLAVPVYGCGYYDKTVFAADLLRLGRDEASRWMQLWDPSVYLPAATMPMLWVTGSNDFAYTLDALQLSYRLTQGPRSLCVRLRMPHGHHGPGENPREIHVFANSILKGETGLPRIVGAGKEGANVWTAYASKAPVVKAELNFTRDSGAWQKRRWEAIPAGLEESRATATLPEGTRAYYFNLYDERECVVSSEHAECL